ncbi:MAG TPA: hemerythrin domain-containing protein [Thermoplasmata archaeon]|nr:hemerythrin domain-containing protein [Thermoplasmata archaeon]
MDDEIVIEPVDTLRDEHEIIERLLFGLEGIADRIRYDVKFPEEDIEEGIRIAAEFTDGCHTTKEEALFPILAKASPNVGNAMVQELTGDHLTIRKLLGAIRNLIPLAARRKGPARDRLARDLRLYTRLVREHIRTEEERFLPEVARRLGRRKRAAIAAEFRRMEEAEGDPGRNQRFQESIRYLVLNYCV